MENVKSGVTLKVGRGLSLTDKSRYAFWVLKSLSFLLKYGGYLEKYRFGT